MSNWINKKLAEKILLTTSKSAKNEDERCAWARAIHVLHSVDTIDGTHIDRRRAEEEIAKNVLRWSNEDDWLAWRSALCALQKVPGYDEQEPRRIG